MTLPNGVDLYRPTASRFKDIITPTGKRSFAADAYIDQLIKWSLFGDGDEVKFSSPWTERGKRLEDDAIKEYSLLRGISVEKQPFIFNKEHKCGCYPDGKADVFIEVKCLKIDNHREILKRGIPIKFKPQLQGTILITNAEEIDFIAYCPGEKTYIETVGTESIFSDLMVEYLAEFNAKLESKFKQAREL